MKVISKSITDPDDNFCMMVLSINGLNICIWDAQKRDHFNPANSEATLVQGTRTQRFSKTLCVNPVMLVYIEKLSQSTLR